MFHQARAASFHASSSVNQASATAYTPASVPAATPAHSIEKKRSNDESQQHHDRGQEQDMPYGRSAKRIRKCAPASSPSSVMTQAFYRPATVASSYFNGASNPFNFPRSS